MKQTELDSFAMSKMPPPSTVVGPSAHAPRPRRRPKYSATAQKPSDGTVAHDNAEQQNGSAAQKYMTWGLLVAVVVLGVLVGVMVVMWINTFRKVKAMETERAATLTETDVKTSVDASIAQYHNKLMVFMRGGGGGGEDAQRNPKEEEQHAPPPPTQPESSVQASRLPTIPEGAVSPPEVDIPVHDDF